MQNKRHLRSPSNPVWLDDETWACRRHVPVAKFPASVEKCLLGCPRIARPPRKDDGVVKPAHPRRPKAPSKVRKQVFHYAFKLVTTLQDAIDQVVTLHGVTFDDVLNMDVHWEQCGMADCFLIHEVEDANPLWNVQQARYKEKLRQYDEDLLEFRKSKQTSVKDPVFEPWRLLDGASKEALEAATLSDLRKYARHVAQIIGASKIRGGKAALIPLIVERMQQQNATGYFSPLKS